MKRKPLKSKFARAFEAQAAEIKRLEAENAELKSIALSRGMELNDAAYDEQLSREEFIRLRARIALLEAALGLPDGCDVFELQVAKVKGARSKDGTLYEYFGTANPDCFVFRQSGKNIGIEVDAKGFGIGIEDSDRLYCIKEANK